MRAARDTHLGLLVAKVFCAAKPPHPVVDVRRNASGALLAITCEPRPRGPGSEANMAAWKEVGDGAARLRKVLRDHLPRGVVHLDDDDAPEIFEAWCRCGGHVLDTAWLRAQIAGGASNVGLP